MTALDVQNLAVSLGKREVLHDVSFTISRGEFVGLLGPNGAGKTTLMRTVLGVQPRTNGSVLIDGHPAAKRRNFVGYVPQRHEFAWSFPISVEQVVMTGRYGHLGLVRRTRSHDWDAVDSALELVGLDHLRRRPVGALSGGQRQRVLVARALALEPSLLVLDEPFTGLDLPAQEHLATLFRTLAQQGHAVLMSTHDLLSAHHGCSRLILLHKTVIADGPPASLKTPAPWIETFGVTTSHPLLRLVEALT